MFKKLANVFRMLRAVSNGDTCVTPKNGFILEVSKKNIRKLTDCDSCSRVIKLAGLENPESFTLRATLVMAIQSLNPEEFDNFIKIYKALCDRRKLTYFWYE